MKSEYPRIVTNGKHYRIEVSKGAFMQENVGDSWPVDVNWETRFFWRARRALNRLLRRDSEYESRKADKWKPVCCKCDNFGPR